MLSSISFEQLQEWHTFFQLEPWGQEYLHIDSGIIASTLCNLKRDAKSTPEPYKWSDFVPKYADHIEDEKPEKTEAEQAKENSKALAALLSQFAKVNVVKTTE